MQVQSWFTSAMVTEGIRSAELRQRFARHTLQCSGEMGSLPNRSVLRSTLETLFKASDKYPFLCALSLNVQAREKALTVGRCGHTGTKPAVFPSSIQAVRPINPSAPQAA